MSNTQTIKSVAVGGVRVDLVLDNCMGRPFFEVAVDGHGTRGVQWAGADRAEAIEAFAQACRDNSPIKIGGGK